MKDKDLPEFALLPSPRVYTVVRTYRRVYHLSANVIIKAQRGTKAPSRNEPNASGANAFTGCVSVFLFLLLFSFVEVHYNWRWGKLAGEGKTHTDASDKRVGPGGSLAHVVLQ